jgi:hypothetical protein
LLSVSGAPGDVGECGDAEVDGASVVGGELVDLGEFLLGAGQADLEPIDFAEPPFPMCLVDAVAKVVADLYQPLAVAGVWPQERAPQT